MRCVCGGGVVFVCAVSFMFLAFFRPSGFFLHSLKAPVSF